MNYKDTRYKDIRALFYRIKHEAYSLENAIEMIKEYDYYTDKGRNNWDFSKEDYFERKERLKDERRHT